MKSANRLRIPVQLKKDLIGKDSHRGITLTYGWLANQMGHFALGFIPTCIFFFIFESEKNALPWSTLGVSVFWLLFEIYNVIAPFLITNKKTVFEPQWVNICFDTFTDLCYFWIGAGTFHLIVNFEWSVFIPFLVILLALTFFSRHWYLTKFFQQSAQFPFQFRLSQWHYDIHSYDKELIEKVIRQEVKGKHLLIYGEAGTGKTALAVGIANELAIKRKRCGYFTMIKFLPKLHNHSQRIRQFGMPWSWRDLDTLIIDDMNSGNPVPKQLIQASDFCHLVDTSPIAKANKRALIKQNVCWVIGDSCDKTRSECSDEWMSILFKMGVPLENIHMIDLNFPNPC